MRRRACLVVSDPGRVTHDHPAFLELEQAGWDVCIVLLPTKGELPPDARIPELYGEGPAERSDVVRHAVEALHKKQHFSLILFSGQGGSGARAVQAKRAGLTFTDTALAIYLDANSQHDREAHCRWPTCFSEVETDFLERFAFENADLQWLPDEGLEAFVKRNHWTVHDNAVRSTPPSPDQLGIPSRKGDPGAGGEPLVTVATAHYNLGRYLPDTLATLAAQTYPSLEVIVIDDGSTDAASVEVFEAMRAKYPAFTFLRQANAGIGATRNRCLELARGDYFIPVDADNLVRPDMIAKFVTAMQRNPEVSAMTCYFLAFDTEAPDFRPTSFRYGHRPAGGPHALAGIRNVYGDANAIFRTAALRAIGGYETDRGTSCEDWEVFVKLVHTGHHLGIVPDHLFYYRFRPGGFSRSTNWFANHQRVLRQFAHPGNMPPAESLALWTALLGFHQRNEQLVQAVLPRRHRIADRVYSVVIKPLKWIKSFIK